MAYSYTVTVVNNSSVHTIEIHLVVPLREKSEAQNQPESFYLSPLSTKVVAVEASSNALNGVHAAIVAHITSAKDSAGPLPSHSYWRWEQDGEVVSSHHPEMWMFLVAGDTTIKLIGNKRPQALKLLCRSDGKLLYADDLPPMPEGLAINNASIYIECTGVATASRTNHLNFMGWFKAFGYGGHTLTTYNNIALSLRYGSAYDGYRSYGPHAWEFSPGNDGKLMGGDGVRPVIVREPAALVCILPWCYEYLNDGYNPTGYYPQSWGGRTYRMALEGNGAILCSVPKINGPFFGLYDWRAKRWLARVCPSIDGMLVNESL